VSAKVRNLSFGTVLTKRQQNPGDVVHFITVLFVVSYRMGVKSGDELRQDLASVIRRCKVPKVS